MGARLRLRVVTDRAEDARRFFLKQFTGFDQVPPDEVQAIYAKALIMCARGDGEFHPEEKAWVRGYFSATGAPQHVIDLVDTFDSPPDEILGVLAAPRSKRSARRSIDLHFRTLACHTADLVLDFPVSQNSLNKQVFFNEPSSRIIYPLTI